MIQTEVGILGCGVISRTYIKDIQEIYQQLHIRACSDADEKRALALGEEFGIPNVYSTQEMLEDKEIEIIINLTPPSLHFELNLSILRAGKHLFCEKPFALTLQQAQILSMEAKQRGLYIAGAPDTFLGAGLQRTRKLLEEGAIGIPLYVTANMMSHGVETWHPNPTAFYKHGAGPLYDMGPYYLTAIVTLLGSIKEIRAVDGTGFTKREIYCGPYEGEMLNVETPTYYSALITLENGILVNLCMSFDIWHSALPLFEIYGSVGTLSVPDPNMTDGMPKVYRKEDVLLKELPEHRFQKKPEIDQNVLLASYKAVREYTRGAGAAELSDAIRQGRTPRACVKLLSHVVEAIGGIIESARSGQIYRMKTGCEKPKRLKEYLDQGVIE